MRGKCDNKEGDFNKPYPFPMVWGYKRLSGIMEVRVQVVTVMHMRRTEVYSDAKLNSLVFNKDICLVLLSCNA
jgi:hypothetical protein